MNDVLGLNDQATDHNGESPLTNFVIRQCGVPVYNGEAFPAGVFVQQQQKPFDIHLRVFGEDLPLGIPADGPVTYADLAAVFTDFMKAADQVAFIVQPVSEGDNPIKSAAARMKHLGDMYDIIEAMRKSLNNEYDKLRLRIIPDLMAESDIRTVTFDGIGRVQLGSDVYASIDASNKESAYEWLRKHNYGDLIQETVNSSTLKSWVKEYQQNATEGTEELPENLFKVTPYCRASIVKANKK